MTAGVLLVLLASLARAQLESTEPTCNFSVKHLTTNQPVNLTQFCKGRACIVKCCPKNEILFKNASLHTRQCVNVNDLQREFGVKTLNDYSSLDIYNEDIKEKVIKTNKKVNELIQLQYINYEEFVSNCSDFILSLVHSFHYAKLYIQEDGALRIRRFNYIDDWFAHYTAGQFCYDRFMYVESDHTVDALAPRFVFLGIPQPGNISEKNRPMLTAYGMVVSCVFLSLVLAVYALLRALRNLPGLLLMAYAATMLAFFLLRAVHVFRNRYDLLSVNDCIVMTILVYYTMLSSFSWMNVMSFDIWWTFRGMRKQRPIQRRGVLVKFLWYCGYAWGAPLAAVVFLIVVDHLDLTRVPAFIKPHVFEGLKCFFDQDSILLYLILPLGLMVCADLILFSLTAYNIWLVRRGVSRCSKKSKAEYRCAVYVKLFLVMGVNWLVEVVSSVVAVDCAVWYVSDVLNGLVGLFIFVMFVCRRRIILDLCSLFSIDGAWVRRLRARGGAGAAGSGGSRSTARTGSGSTGSGSTADSGVDMNPEPLLNEFPL